MGHFKFGESIDRSSHLRVDSVVAVFKGDAIKAREAEAARRAAEAAAEAARAAEAAQNKGQ